MSYQMISKYRKYIMGVAALLIIICHNNLVVNLQPWEMMLGFIRHFFQIGVDVFLLVSGMGGVFSYVKCNLNTGRFLHKRFMRIIPTYVVAIGLWGLFSILVGWGIESDFFWEYSIISFYINGSGSEWYVSAILLLYLLFPFFYKVLQKNRRLYISMGVAVIILSFVLSFVCRTSNFNEIFVVRIPIYMMGILIGDKLIKKEDKTHNTKLVLCEFWGCVLLILLNYIFNDYNRWWVTRMLFMPTAVTFSLILGWRMECKKVSKLKKLVTSYGSYTLENYLVNEKVLTIFACTVHRFVSIPVLTSVLVNILGAIFTIVSAIFLNKLLILIVHIVKKVTLCKPKLDIE